MFRRFSLLALLLLISTTARGVDGVVEINQASALAGSPTDSAGFPVGLGASGSYRLTSNLEPNENESGFVISASDVTLDLNGFSILCTGGFAGDGIVSSSFARNVTIRNGTIRGCIRGISLSGHPVIESVRAIGNTQAGIDCLDSCIVRDSIVEDNGGTGIHCGYRDPPEACLIERSRIRKNQIGISCGDDCVVVGSEVRGNSAGGISTGVRGRIQDNTIESNGGAGVLCENASTIRGNLVRNNTAGISAARGALVQGNNVLGSTEADGIRVERRSVVVDNISRDNVGGDGIETDEDCRVQGNTTTNNGAVGIRVKRGSVVADNSSGANGEAGIEAESSVTITGNNTDQNTGSGIAVGNASLLQGNVANSNGGAGLSVGSGGNVIGNVARSNTGLGLDAAAEDIRYSDNLFNRNNGGNANPQINQGLDAGGNVCGTTLGCP